MKPKLILSLLSLSMNCQFSVVGAMSSNKKSVISDLSNELVSTILSNLPTKEAVAVCFLLRKGAWRNKMVDLSRLEFYFDNDQEEHSFVRFINTFLMLRGPSKLDSFSLTIHNGMQEEGVQEEEVQEERLDSDVVNHWIHYALDNGVESLEIRIHEILEVFELPPRVLLQDSLVDLKLGASIGSISIYGNHEIVLPKLKKLCLADIGFGDSAMFASLISNCPVLEELLIEDMKWQTWEACVVRSKTFVIGISGVRKLEVSENTIEVLDLKRGSIPQFMNLTQLQIKSFETMGWGSVPELLRNCPSLEELIFHGLFHMTGDGCGDYHRDSLLPANIASESAEDLLEGKASINVAISVESA
ncbi:unnamed protein product [Thlaspi arvense]|uniref:F-box/LRR-repeat protein 15/At3g58940/PEG3-like LRR domain-containing protein n=1 Tax=Thlaspi arvense TaxID=13288 RepID=A0AAU9SD68_THLAR|nr:unnamed protein product [Thlaspi arvense]